MASHEIVEKNVGLLMIFIVLVISIAGLVEIIPLFALKQTTQPVADLKPYTPLQLTGRDIYIREGCNNCHSQMIRPFRAETERYGHYSVAGEFVYDHPFLWGSKRTGPDLARVGGKYSDDWLRVHFMDPRSVVPESNMPAFPWLAHNKLDTSTIQKKMRVMNELEALTCNGCKHYTAKQIADAPKELQGKTEMDALIAYLQNLGTDIKVGR